MSECAIEVKNLCVNYRGLQKYSIRRNFFTFKRKKVEMFEAVKNVSFTVEKGEILGIVGRNGSGKSTLLKTLAGIFSPDSGTIDTKGNSVSLLSIGVGYQREMTGRENIMLSGMLLGFDEAFIRQKEAEIIEFSELGKFIDMPVKSYSSGMYSKLAFSITAILETDIMMIDEVLSVGDAKFKKKSYAKMKSLINDQNRTVLIVSHSSDTLRKLCTSILWLHDGDVRKIGKASEVLAEYEEFMK
ncbi:MAG: ABC transporter ATP-binding protein [Clostridiales bacterium]|nr:ABC transporter ATP-binding protein [Clostridiales bacterium]